MQTRDKVSACCLIECPILTERNSSKVLKWTKEKRPESCFFSFSLVLHTLFAFLFSSIWNFFHPHQRCNLFLNTHTQSLALDRCYFIWGLFRSIMLCGWFELSYPENKRHSKRVIWRAWIGITSGTKIFFLSFLHKTVLFFQHQTHVEGILKWK